MPASQADATGAGGRSASKIANGNGMARTTSPIPPDSMGEMAGMAGMATPAPTSQAGPPPWPPAEADPPQGRPPGPPLDHAADRFYDPSEMAAAREVLRRAHGGDTISMVMANIAEGQSQPGGGYRWDGEAWVGGDLDRLVFKSEGDGGGREGLGSAEAQVLISRAVSAYFDLQAGVRQDVAPHARTYAAIGFQGLAPYWLDVSGTIFLSTKGELLGRLEGAYDLRLTQRLILQPRAELNFAAQDSFATQTGSGLSRAELGLRLRYEIRREFAPYVGLSWDRKLGETADYARARGQDIGGAAFVAGVRAWF